MKLGIISMNEGRDEIGRETIGPDGDIIFQPSTLVPVGRDQFTEDNAKKPQPRVRTSKSKFVEIMKKYGYSEDDIEKAWKEGKQND